jgi:alkyl sulfatase BDS1-like metallo-beta-lactamase superfamily hydrolase
VRRDGLWRRFRATGAGSTELFQLDPPDKPRKMSSDLARDKQMTQSDQSEAPKEASASVVAQHAATLNALPFTDTRDFEDASRGFLGTVENARIASAQGRVVWSLEPYGFLSHEEAPATVNPSLWRQSRLNMQHGLFEVLPGVYQVRGLDIANMTLIEGERGASLSWTR